MTGKVAKGAMSASAEKLLAHMGDSASRFFNQLCRELDGKVSRRTIFKNLVLLENQGLVRSSLVSSSFSERKITVHRWVRAYTITQKGKRLIRR